MKTLQLAPRALWILAVVLCSSSTIRSQTNTLLVGPTVLSFTHQTGAVAPPAKSVLVLSTGTSLAFSTAVATTSGGNWLSVGLAGGSTPATLAVSVNPIGLAVGDYTGTVTLTSAGASNSPVAVAVALAVRTSSQLAVTPHLLTFHFQTGGSVPAGQVLAITSNGSPLTYTVAATTSSGGSWLLANPISGTTPGEMAVTVNPAALPVGTYNGSITVTATGASNSPATIPVTLTVSANPQLTLSPASLTFHFQTGGAAPAAQPVTVSSSGTSLPFTVTFGTTAGGSWLIPSPLSGATPAILGVSVNAAGLGAGTYNGSITVTASGAANSPQTISVTLIVTTSPLLSVSPGTLSFDYQVGGAIPASQSLTVASSSAALNYAAAVTSSGGAWLAAGPLSGSTSGTVTVEVSPAGLAPGTYTGVITITAAAAGNSPVVVAVRLVVGFSPLLSVNPASLSFAFQTGRAVPASQAILVTSTGQPLTFSIATSTTAGGNWLSVSTNSAATPATFTVAVAPAGLAAGSYNGTITLTAAGAGNSPVAIGMTLVVSASALLVVSPGSLVFDVAAGTAGSVVRSVSLISTDGTPLSFTVSSSTSAGGGWLLVGPQSGSTPSTLNISVNASGLSTGSYTGSVAVTAAVSANSPQTIAVTVRVAAAAAIAASPGSLSFTQATGGAPPALANLAITSSGGAVSFTAGATTSSGGNWLSVTPSGAVTPATLSVLANGGGLVPGSYSGLITIVSAEASNSPLNITVTLTVGATLASSATSLAYSFQIGSSTPASQTISLSASGGVALEFTAAASTTSGNWLAVSPASGATPATLNVSVNPAGLAAGTHDGAITIASTGAVTSPLRVTVRLVVTAAPIVPFIASVTNAASFQPSSVSPGLIVTLFGTTIGPTGGVGLRVNASGVLDTSIGDTRVYFDGIQAPRIFASDRQTSAIVPYTIAGRFNTRMQVEYQGVRSNVVELRVVDAAPGVFTLGSTGAGQGAILNQNFSVNGPANPVPRGSVVMIYATGEGATTPAGVDGLVTGSVLRLALQTVSVTIAGQTADVLYAGSAPGLVSGVVQINARVPASVTPGSTAPVFVTIAGARSQTGVTMAVQ